MANSINNSATPKSTATKPTQIGGTQSTEREDIGSTLRDAAERFTNSEMGGKAREYIDDATEIAEEFYGRASQWLDGNYGRVVGGIAILGAVGLFGYYLGKSSRNSSLPELRDY